MAYLSAMNLWWTNLLGPLLLRDGDEEEDFRLLPVLLGVFVLSMEAASLWDEAVCTMSAGSLLGAILFSCA